MYGNRHSVKSGIYQAVRVSRLRFVVGICRKTLCFGRFPRELSDSDALHQIANYVCPLTMLVRSSPISPCLLVGPRTNEADGHPNACPIWRDELPPRCGYASGNRERSLRIPWAIESAIAWNVQNAGRDIFSPAARTSTVLTSFQRLSAHPRSTRCIAPARRNPCAATGREMT